MSDGGPGRREVAHRLFAAEFDDADHSYSESDEERAPNYVVTPTGARVNRVFVVGVLTEVETVGDDYLRARVVDPTGAFVVYAGQYQPEALAFLEDAEPPAFVAVTGKARTFEPDDGDEVYTSIRPESIRAVDAETRDRWTVDAAERTVERIGRIAAALDSQYRGDELEAALRLDGTPESLAAGIPIAIEHYGTTGRYLVALRELALDAARQVADEIDEVDALTVAPDADGAADLGALLDTPLTVDRDALDAELAAMGAPSATDDAGESAGSEPATGDAPAPSDDPADETASATGTAQSGASSGDAGKTDAATDAGETETAAADAGETETAADAGETVAAASGGGGTATAVEESGQGAEATPAGDATDDALSGDEVAKEADADASSDDDTAAETDAEDVADASPADDDGELEDFEPEFELDEEEREELEEEFGAEFESGTEVDDPGEADIDAPDESELIEDDEKASDSSEGADGAAAEPESPTQEDDGSDTPEGADDGADDAGVEGDETSEDEAAENEAAENEAAEDDAIEEEAVEDDASDDDGDADADVDLETAVLDAMGDLDDGDGADRAAVVDDVVEATGAAEDAVDDAIQEALMDGKCFEPESGRLKPI